MKAFVKEYKTQILWIVAMVLVLAVCGVWIVLSRGGENASSGTGSDASLSGSSDSPSSPEPEPVPEQNFLRFYSDLDEKYCRVGYLNPTILDMPQDLSKSSSPEDCILYTYLRTGFTLGSFSVDYANDLAAADPELLIWFLHIYETDLMYDPALAEEDYYGSHFLPAERVDGVYTYTVETISGLLYDLYGVKDFVIDCDAYDAATQTYTITDFGRGYPFGPRLYGTDVEWTSDDTFSCTVLGYPMMTEEGERPEKQVKEDQWVEKYTFHMKRDPENRQNFYLDRAEMELQPNTL